MRYLDLLEESGELERIQRQSRGYPYPVPVMGTGKHVCDGLLIDQHELAPPDDRLQGMAGFTTYDQIINSLTVDAHGEYRDFNKGSMTTVASNVYSRWQATGIPAAGTFGTSGTARAIDNTFAAALPFTSATGGRTKHLLSFGVGSTISLGTVCVYDRLAEYPFTGTTTSASFTTVTLPSRDLAGTGNGDGIMMFLENFSATATAAVTVTPTYTNSAGTGSRTNAFTSIVTAALAGTIANGPAGLMWLPLASGDVGVRKIDSYTLSASILAANMCFVLARPIAWIPLLAQGSFTERDFVLQIANIPRLYDGTAMGLNILANTTTCPLNGRYVAAEN